jgi:hypothetical protein
MRGLRPATYQLTIQKDGFRTIIQPGFQLYAQDAVNENFTYRHDAECRTHELGACRSGRPSPSK